MRRGCVGRRSRWKRFIGRLRAGDVVEAGEKLRQKGDGVALKWV
jgi:hypothetical protein